MSDPIAQAAAGINAPSSTEPAGNTLAVDAAATSAQASLPTAPDAALTGGETGSNLSSNQGEDGRGEAGNGQATEAAQKTDSGALSAGPTSTPATATEHPHTSILRRVVGLIRRDFNMLSGELESWVAEAERHL